MYGDEHSPLTIELYRKRQEINTAASNTAWFSIQNSIKKKDDSRKPNLTLSDIKALANDDPVWTVGKVKPKKSPLAKYVKYIQISYDSDEQHLSNMGKYYTYM